MDRELSDYIQTPAHYSDIACFFAISLREPLTDLRKKTIGKDSNQTIEKVGILTREWRNLSLRKTALPSSIEHPDQLSSNTARLKIRCSRVYLGQYLQSDVGRCQHPDTLANPNITMVIRNNTRSFVLTCHCVFIQRRLESRSFVHQVARVEQRTIGGAGRGCVADRPLR